MRMGVFTGKASVNFMGLWLTMTWLAFFTVKRPWLSIKARVWSS